MDPSSSLSTSALFADLGLVLFALFLVLLNGFFVAAEFSMVKLRSTKVEAIAEQHGWRGHILRTVHSQLDAYLSACQLGITLASLGLGWVGEPAFAELLTPVLSAIGIESQKLVHGISFFVAFFIISYLHIVVGELAPKSWAIRKPELGTLKPGSVGDASILELRDGSLEYLDVIGEKVVGKQRLLAAGVVLGGKWWHPA